MRRGLSAFRGWSRINRGLLLSRLYRIRGVFWALLALVLLALAFLAAQLVRLAAGLLGSA